MTQLHIMTRMAHDTWWRPWTAYVLRSADEPIGRDTPRTDRKWTERAAYAAADRIASKMARRRVWPASKEES
jgi:hypothetical protein